MQNEQRKKIIVVDAFQEGCAGPNFFTGGVERHNYILCKVLSKMGYEVNVIQTTHKDLTPEECSYGMEGVKQHFIGPSLRRNPEHTALERKNASANWGRETFKKFQETTRRLSDAVFAFNNAKGRHSRYLCELGIPTLQPTHCSTHQFGGLPGSVDKYLQAPRFFPSDIFQFGYISDFVKHDYMLYSEKYLTYKITEDYMTEHIEALSEFDGEVLPQGDYITVISRCNPDKQPHLALEIAAANNIDLHFFTVVQDRKYYEKHIQKFEGHPNIKFFANQSHDKIMEDLRGSRGLVMTSRKETFGIAGVEALERGVPIMYMDNIIHLTHPCSMAPQDALVSPEIRDMIPKSPDLKDLEEKMKTVSFSLEEREKIARATRGYFSEERWMQNLEKIISKKPTTKKTALF